MIDLYYGPTPNGWKVSIALEEMGLEYNVIPTEIGRGDQYKPEFMRISTNAKMPAIVDHEPSGGGPSLALAESALILRYLAEKSGQFFPTGWRERYDAEQWLYWQMAHLGPMLGQHGHFFLYAEQKIPYAIDRYRTEVLRLFGVLDRRLEGREHICGEYSIVDMACWPWVLTYKSQNIDLDQFANVRHWYDSLKSRPGLRRGYDLGKEKRSRRGDEAPDEEARKHMFSGGPDASRTY